MSCDWLANALWYIIYRGQKAHQTAQIVIWTDRYCALTASKWWSERLIWWNYDLFQSWSVCGPIPGFPQSFHAFLRGRLPLIVNGARGIMRWWGESWWVEIMVCKKLANPWRRENHTTPTYSTSKCPTYPYRRDLFYRTSWSGIIEAIQTLDGANDGVSSRNMTKPLPSSLRGQIFRLLLLQWRPDDIAKVVHCHKTTVYRMQQSLFIWGAPY